MYRTLLDGAVTACVASTVLVCGVRVWMPTDLTDGYNLHAFECIQPYYIWRVHWKRKRLFRGSRFNDLFRSRWNDKAFTNA